jgi:ATP-dependent Lhr-like helicase
MSWRPRRWARAFHGAVVAERFFDEGGGMRLVIRAPFGARINRAWGLALRKRFAAFNFAAGRRRDSGIVISLGEQHLPPTPSNFCGPRWGCARRLC